MDAALPVGNPACAEPSKGHGEDDRTLVARVRGGDAAAYAELIDRHGGRIHAMLLHLAGGDAGLAAEFTEEAFSRAWERLDQFAGQSSFFTWLWRLARNRALDLLARKRPQAADLEPLGATAGGPAPGDAVGTGELREQVQRALAALPADQRELLLLREWEGLDYARLAEVLGVAEGTVKSRLSRARAALRDRLAGVVSAEDLP